MRLSCGMIFSLLLCCAFSFTVDANQSRVALVIGNNAYPPPGPSNLVGPLKNPRNDADDMGRALHQYGFDVLTLRDATLQQMEQAVETLRGRLRPDGVGVFYFSGHGVQVDSANYLLPTGRV